MKAVRIAILTTVYYSLFVLAAIAAVADCAHHGLALCPMLEKARQTTRPVDVPEAIYAGNIRFEVQMRDGKQGFDCYGETWFRGKDSVILLADNQSNWNLRETLHHEVSHISAHVHDDKQCKFRDEDAAIEHLSPGWIDILADRRNHQLVEFLINAR